MNPSRAVLVGAVALGVVLGVTMPGAGQVDGSKHDFSGRDAAGRDSSICTMCHTPHYGYRTPLLWNHTLASNIYRWSKTSTVGGTRYPTIGPNWTGSARFCLSCHDGSVAIGDIAWFNAQSWTGRPIDPNDHDGDNVQIGTATGDLTNNHPISFPYPFGGVVNSYNGVTTGAGAVAGFRPDPTVTGIRLFRQNGGLVTAGTQVGSTGIECSSCHDPHNDPSAVEDAKFLRGSTEFRNPNYICRKCHFVMGDYEDDRSLHPHRPR